MILCLSVNQVGLHSQELPDANSCTGYVVVAASDYRTQALTYPDANQLLGAVGLLFVLAFLFRALRKQIGF